MECLAEVSRRDVQTVTWRMKRNPECEDRRKLARQRDR